MQSRSLRQFVSAWHRQHDALRALGLRWRRCAATEAAAEEDADGRLTGIRRLMGSFLRSVHPDLTPDFPEEALRINQRSLSELNAYVDRLESSASRLEDGPEVSRQLPFFRNHVTRSGKLLPGRVLPFRLQLPSLPVLASDVEKEYAAARLIRDAEVVLEHAAGVFSDQPEVPSLFTSKNAGRDAFDKLWWRQTREEMVFEAIHGPDDAEVRRQAAMVVFAQKYEYQMLRKVLKIKNNQRRRRKLAAVKEVVEDKVRARFPDPAISDRQVSEEKQDKEDVARIIKGGFHPDLVFVVPDLSQEQRREAISRVCGLNLQAEADIWLLENLWKAMRETPPPVPLVVAQEGYKAHMETGFVQVPWDFTVTGVCDLLEEHLDDVRAGLQRRRQRFSAHDMDFSELPQPPPALPDWDEAPELMLPDVAETPRM
eukprot:TRINITY_DN90380_c0_g1_i1.p1 TRINITY_DN90380_c0_g1~~TRINITY_DN90380_c0_g1_i1.p1  ORF type:complete len:427 (-),score=78.18 TRINITY_DN90380_c0_g1_i1:413-1693(-)